MLDYIGMILRNAIYLDSSAIPAIPNEHGAQSVGQIRHLHVFFGVVNRSESFHNYFRIIFLSGESTVLDRNLRIFNITVA